MTSQPDSEYHAAGATGSGERDSANPTEEQGLDPEVILVPQIEAHSDDLGVDSHSAVGDISDAETAHHTSGNETVAAEATHVDEVAEPANGSPGAEWHDIQAMFVDDPRRSVQFAAEQADAAVSALVELLQRRRSALATAASGAPVAPGDTEELREMLRSYRIFCQSISDLGDQLRNAAATTR